MSVLVSIQYIVELTQARDAMEVYMWMSPRVAQAGVVTPCLPLPHRARDLWFPAEVVEQWLAELCAAELRSEPWTRR